VNAAVIPAFFLHDPLWIPLAAYLLGSIPFAKLLGADRDAARGGPAVRRRRNGRSGAETENVARRRARLLTDLATVLLDAAKGYFAVWLAMHFTQANIHWMMYAALSALVGDIFPIWLGFRGGRGVATAAGAFLGICWPAVAIAFSVWLLVLWFWDYVSLASISAAAALPMFMYILYAPSHAPPEVVSFGTMLASVLVIMRHSGNIQRLLSGTEPHLGTGKPTDDPEE